METNPFLIELAHANGTTVSHTLDMFLESHRRCEAVMMEHDQSALAHRCNTIASASAPHVHQNAGDAGDPRESDATRVAKKASDALQQMSGDCLDADDVEHLVQKAAAHDAIAFILPRPNCTEGTALRHVMAILEAHHRRPFKIGISTDPSHRWANPGYGYQSTRDKCGVLFTKMDVLFASTSKQAIGMLEATLISLSRSRSWPCANIAPGGESKIEAPIYFAYVVH